MKGPNMPHILFYFKKEISRYIAYNGRQILLDYRVLSFWKEKTTFSSIISSKNQGTPYNLNKPVYNLKTMFNLFKSKKILPNKKNNLYPQSTFERLWLKNL